MPRLALENRQLVIGGLDELSEAGSKGQQESIIEKNHNEIAELHKRIEKAGKEIEGMSPLYHNYPLPVGAKGEIVVSMCYSDHHGIPVWKAERMGRIDHYVLVLSDSNLAKQAEKSEKEARESAKKQESAK